MLRASSDLFSCVQNRWIIYSSEIAFPVLIYIVLFLNNKSKYNLVISKLHTMDCVSGWCTSKNRLDGSAVIVTGCNTGIGKETALDLYKRGARVIMACRHLEKAAAAKEDIEKIADTESKGELVVYELDLCSLRSVRKFAATVMAQERNLKVLICNAGVMMCPQGVTEDGFETHMGSNHHAHALLALLLLPTLIRNGPSRIVFLSSKVHTDHAVDLDDLNFERKPYKAYEAYCRSKCANILFAKALATQLKMNNITQVTTYSLHPGVIRTEISRHFDKTFMSGATFVFNNLFYPFLKSPECGAQTTIYCAIDDKCANESGLYYSDCAVKALSKDCSDESRAAKLWELTVNALKLDLTKYNPFGTQNPTEDIYHK